MEQEFVRCRDGVYAVDWGLVETIIRSYLLADGILRHSREEVTEKWIGPDIHQWTVDWDEVRKEKDRAKNLTKELRQQAIHYGMQTQLRQLKVWIRHTRSARDSWRKKMKEAQEKSIANVNASAKHMEWGEETAKFVRDVSGAVLIAGATVLTGGAASGLAGVATLSGSINAATQYQDTGSGTSATFAFVTGFTIGVIPGAKAGAKASEKAAMILLKLKFETMSSFGQALVDGKSIENSMTESLVTAVSGGLGHGFGKLSDSAAGRKMLRKLAYPATIKIDYGKDRYVQHLGAARDFTKDIVKGVEGNLTKRGVKAGSDMIRATTPAPLVQKRPIVDHAVILDELLLNKAIQGPGQSEYRTTKRRGTSFAS